VGPVWPRVSHRRSSWLVLGRDDRDHRDPLRPNAACISRPDSRQWVVKPPYAAWRSAASCCWVAKLVDLFGRKWYTDRPDWSGSRSPSAIGGLAQSLRVLVAAPERLQGVIRRRLARHPSALGLLDSVRSRGLLTGPRPRSGSLARKLRPAVCRLRSG